MTIELAAIFCCPSIACFLARADAAGYEYPVGSLPEILLRCLGFPDYYYRQQAVQMFTR
jgi:hypothetical protein